LLPAGTVDPDDRPYITLKNPINVERVAMRHSLLASLVEVVASNSRYRDRIAMFEVSKVYLASESGVLPDELRRLAIAMTGVREGGHWQDGTDSGTYDFFDLKGVLEDLLADLHVTEYRIEADSHPTWRPGRTARLWVGKTHVGWFGELHPLVVEEMDIRTESAVLAAELDLDALLAAVPAGHSIVPIAQFPAVQEDLALVVDKSVTSGQVAATIQRAGGFLLKNVELFDVYEGEQVGAGKKSLAYHLTFQSPSKTLSDKDTQKQRKRILGTLRNQLGAELR
jgi:phenylalanyl-tRNA synthetase beta chain